MGKHLASLFIVLSGMSFTHATRAQDNPEPVDDTTEIDNFRRELEGALVNPVVYTGQEGANTYEGEFMWCEEQKTRWLEWQAPVQQVTSHRVPTTGQIQMTMSFQRSYVEVRAYTKQAWSFCNWSGGETRVDVGSIQTNLSLTPVSGRDFPDVSVDGIKLDDINIQVGAQFGPLKFHFDLFNTLEEGIEVVVNKTIKSMLASTLKDRFNAFITERLGRKLDEIRRSHASPGEPISAPIH